MYIGILTLVSLFCNKNFGKKYSVIEKNLVGDHVTL